MQLHSQQLDIEAALAEFIAAAFSPAERQIASLKAIIAKTPPRSHMRIIYEHRMRDIRIQQLRQECGIG